jgi:hypothetical protein
MPYCTLFCSFFQEIVKENCIVETEKKECGACEYAWPTKPYKAIYVEGNPKHLRAEIPPPETPEQEIDHKEEFPF